MEEQCQYCQIKSIDRGDNPESVLCRECREQLIRYPVPKKIMVAAVILAVLLIIALLQFPNRIREYKIYRQAETNAQEGIIYSTLVELEELCAKYSDSEKLPLKILKIAMEYGYYDFAAYTVNTYLQGKKLSEWEYDEVLKAVAVIEKYYATYDAFEALIQDADQENDVDRIRQELTRMEQENTFYRPLVSYYQGMVAKDQSSAAVQYLKAYQEDSNLTYAAAQAANYYRRTGDLKTARTYLEEAYGRNREDPEVLRGMAIVEMLEGNSAEGLTMAEEAYRLSPEGQYVADTYLVALMENGKTKEMEQVKKTGTESGITWDEQLEEFLKGKMTLADYYCGE